MMGCFQHLLSNILRNSLFKGVSRARNEKLMVGCELSHWNELFQGSENDLEPLTSFSPS